MKRDWMEQEKREDKILFSGFVLVSGVEKFIDGEEKSKVIEKIKDARKHHNPSADYGENGFRFSDETLEQMGRNIILLPLEWMADYISLEHKTLVDGNSEELLSSFSSMIKSQDLYYVFMYMKLQLLAGASYVILNAKDECVFNSALEFLDLYREYYLALMTNNKEELSKQI